MRTLIPLLTAALVLGGGMARAQTPAPSIEGTVGYAGFVDDATIDHLALGGSARVYLTPRLSIQPEVTYMRGPGTDRDWIVTGNLVFDFVGPDASGKPPAVSPYVVAGGGLFHHSNKFGDRAFSSTEGAFTGGGGVRIAITDRFYLAPEARLGWELHSRLTVTLGWRLR
jgi:hypothetical protein